MIIKRKYEWFGYLYEVDDDVKEIIDKAFENADSPDEWKQKVLEYNYYNISACFNIGCGLPRDSYSYIMECFDKLDAEKPYDNGLTFKEVNSIEYETSRKGTAIQMRFVQKGTENMYRIVGFAALENIDGDIKVNPGWNMTNPYVVG